MTSYKTKTFQRNPKDSKPQRLTFKSLSWISSTITWLMPRIPDSSFLSNTPVINRNRLFSAFATLNNSLNRITKEEARTDSAEENAGVRSGKHRLETHAVPTAFPHFFCSFKGHTFRHGHGADASRLTGWASEVSHDADLLTWREKKQIPCDGLTWVTTILQSDAFPLWMNSSSMYWGTWVVFPHPVAPRMMTTGLLWMADMISFSKFLTGSWLLSLRIYRRKNVRLVEFRSPLFNFKTSDGGFLAHRLQILVLLQLIVEFIQQVHVDLFRCALKTSQTSKD